MVKVLEVKDGNLNRKNNLVNIIRWVFKSDIMTFSESLNLFLCFTFIDTVAETTLETTTAIDELHVGTHVGLTAVAADRAGVSVIYNIQRSLNRKQEHRICPRNKYYSCTIYWKFNIKRAKYPIVIHPIMV